MERDIKKDWERKNAFAQTLHWIYLLSSLLHLLIGYMWVTSSTLLKIIIILRDQIITSMKYLQPSNFSLNHPDD